MMWGRRLLTAALAALLTAACSQEEASDWPAPSPAIWEVRGPSGVEGWLAGTMHAFPAEFAWQSEAWDTAFDQSDLLVLEIADYDTRNATAAQFWRFAHADTALPPAAERLPPQFRARLTALLAEHEIGADGSRRLDSWALAVLAGQASAVGDRFPGADRRLFLRALERRAYPVVALESAELQFALFDDLPQEEQLDLLELTLIEADGVAVRSDANARAWLVGDTDTLERSLFATIFADSELRDALVLSRNRNWAERIDRLLREQRRPFVAVGTAHLLGEDSVRELLGERGWVVRRLR